MADFPYRCALIMGAGTGRQRFARSRRLSKIGLQVGLAARDVEKLKPLAEESCRRRLRRRRLPAGAKWLSCSSTWSARSRSPIS